MPEAIINAEINALGTMISPRRGSSGETYGKSVNQGRRTIFFGSFSASFVRAVFENKWDSSSFPSYSKDRSEYSIESSTSADGKLLSTVFLPRLERGRGRLEGDEG